MLSSLDKSAVTTFLQICKKEIAKGNCYFINRNLNTNGKIINSKQALLNLGIVDAKLIWKYILNLTENELIKIDYDYNPKMDMNSEIFIFKANINKKTVYIKLTTRKKGLICISFHEDY